MISSGQYAGAGRLPERRDYLYNPQRGDRYRRYVTSLICSVLSIVFFLFMAVLNFAQNYYSMAAALLLCIFVCVFCILLQLASGDSTLPAWLLCSTHILLSWYLIALARVGVGSLVWTFVYPHAFMLWLGLAQGTALSLFFLASVSVLTLSPLNGLWHESFGAGAALRYTVTLAGLCFFAFISEYIRDRLQKKLLHLNRQMRHTALTDPLTGLGNRLAFEQHLRAEYARFLRQGDDFCLIMGDIDHFKNINDCKGHAVGDAVLQHTAEVLAAHLRRQDGIFRWGGEEFAITLTGIPQRDLGPLAESLRQAVAETPCPYQDDKIYYTMSFGAYSCNPLESAAEALDNADRLLYAAKRAGRNRVMTSDNPY